MERRDQDDGRAAPSTGLMVDRRFAGPKTPSLDVVIPVRDEEAGLGLLFEALQRHFDDGARARHGLGRVRYILVDDGSRDASAALIVQAIRGGLPGVLLRLSRNFGHQNALSAGVAHSDADLVGIIDADLQDPLEVLLQMVVHWREGHDVVYGVRCNRKEGLLRRAGYALFYRLINLFAEVPLPLDAGDFCLMDGRVVAALRQTPEQLRYLRFLRAWVGFRQMGLPYDRPARAAGRPKYTLRMLYRLATDGLASAGTRPLKFASFSSFVFFLLSACAVGALWLSPEFIRELELNRAELVLFSIVILGISVQTFCIYILGAYVGRTYLEAKRRPGYVVAEIVDRTRAGDG